DALVSCWFVKTSNPRTPRPLPLPTHFHREIIRHALRGGPAIEFIFGALADAGARPVEHTAEADAVVRVERQPQKGQRILDLLALVEARAADQLVGQGAGDQRLLDGARLRVGAVHDRDVARAVLAAGDQA